MGLLDDHLLKRLPESRQTLAPFLSEEEALLWVDYQRPTTRLYRELLREALAWFIGCTALLGFAYSIFTDAPEARLQGLVVLSLLLLFGLFVLAIPFKNFLLKLRHPKNNLYGLTATHLLILKPWEEIPARYALAELPTLKTFARTDGTFTVSQTKQMPVKDMYNPDQSNVHLYEEVLVLDAIGDRSTVALVQRLQQKAKQKILPSLD